MGVFRLEGPDGGKCQGVIVVRSGDHGDKLYTRWQGTCVVGQWTPVVGPRDVLMDKICDIVGRSPRTYTIGANKASRGRTMPVVRALFRT